VRLEALAAAVVEISKRIGQALALDPMTAAPTAGTLSAMTMLIALTGGGRR
jgi:hypothetical protein